MPDLRVGVRATETLAKQPDPTISPSKFGPSGWDVFCRFNDKKKIQYLFHGNTHRDLFVFRCQESPKLPTPAVMSDER